MSMLRPSFKSGLPSFRPHASRLRAAGHQLARLLLGAAALSSVQTAALVAQSLLPATAHTSTLASTPAGTQTQAAPLAATASGAPSRHTQKAQVTFENGLLDVRADNSSLNAILREISRTTGMKLTGGVAEQRVFGNYGPAAPGTVLATLLDGTGSNMLLRETADASPAELILTPRLGGPSPPSPANYSADGEDGATDPGNAVPNPLPGNPTFGNQAPTAYGRRSISGTGVPSAQNPAANGNSLPPSIGQPTNNVYGSPNNVSPTPSTYPTTNSIPLDALPTPSTAPPVSGIVEAPNPPPPGTTTSVIGTMSSDQQTGSANASTVPATAATATAPGTTGTAEGPKTPEQVFQLLQQLRQQSLQQQKPQQ